MIYQLDSLRFLIIHWCSSLCLKCFTVPEDAILPSICDNVLTSICMASRQSQRVKKKATVSYWAGYYLEYSGQPKRFHGIIMKKGVYLFLRHQWCFVRCHSQYIYSNFNAFGKTSNFKDDTIHTCMSKSIRFTSNREKPSLITIQLSTDTN